MIDDAITVLICLDHAFLKGGQERVAFDSAIGLKQKGHRPIVFTAIGPVAAELVAADIETVCLDQGKPGDSPTGAMHVLWNRPAARALTDLLATLPRARTIIHVHGWAGGLSSSIAGPIARSGFPAIFTIHDYSQFCPTGDFYDYQQKDICRLTPLSAACWTRPCGARSYPRKLWRNVRLTTAQHVAQLPRIFGDYIALSDLQQSIVAPMIPEGKRLHRVSNPVPVPDLGRRREGVTGDPIFVGRLSPEKGALLFAEAARRAGMIPTFVGGGPVADDIANTYPEAKLLGWQDRSAVHRAMRGARALVFPSVWYEGQGLTVLEAQGLGVPAIVSDACAARDSIEDGVTGLLFKSGDVDDLARALVTTRDDTRMRAMSDAAYARFWRKPPTLDAHVEQLLGVYRVAMDRAVSANGVHQSIDGARANQQRVISGLETVRA